MAPLIIIPSRKGSIRLPNKPMVELDGKTLIRHVWEKAIDTGYTTLVATDSQEIKDHVESFGGISYMTSESNVCGTDRVRECYHRFCEKAQEPDIVINLQGDMPFISPDQIIESTLPLKYGFDIGTLVYEMSPDNIENRNCVKAVCSQVENEIVRCHWFSRVSLSYGYHHAGIYSFTPSVLCKKLQVSIHEKIEKLEQLRYMENGYFIGACLTSEISVLSLSYIL